MKEEKGWDSTHPDWNKVDDYALSKFQGKHGNDSESYNDIRKFVDEHKMNVLSLRNRTGKHEDKSGVKRTLSALTHKIYDEMGKVNLDFRCLFCRVENDPAWRDMLTGERLG